MDQPGKVANPARGQLNRENEHSPVPVRAWEFGLARRVQPSRPASACSSPYSGWIWCLLTDSSRVPRRRPLWNRHTPSGQSRVYRVTQLRTDGVHCRESAGTGPVNLKVVPNGCCLAWQITMDQLIFASLSHTHYWYEVGMLKGTYVHVLQLPVRLSYTAGCWK